MANYTITSAAVAQAYIDIHDPWMRLYGSPFMRLSGRWSKSNVFSRCRWCGHTSIRGVCHSCGHASVCCYCGGVHQPDGSWIKVALPKDKFKNVKEKRLSHGCCEGCKTKVLLDVKRIKKGEA